MTSMKWQKVNIVTKNFEGAQELLQLHVQQLEKRMRAC